MKKNRKGKKKRRRKPRCGPGPLGFTAHPAPPRQPACQPRPPSPSARGPACGPAHVAHAHASSARLPSLPPDPTRQPHITHARAPLRFLLATAATWPRMSATPVHSVVFSTPTPNRPHDRAPTAVAGRTRGSRPRHGPVSLAPRSRNLTRAV